jgi:glycosyltransferase involved in cell wall biosynthesis
VTRVVHVIARMNVGGPAELLVHLLRGLPGQELITGRVEEGEADHLTLRASHIPYRVIEGLGRSLRPGDDLRALAALVRELRSRKPQIVHTHTAKAGVLGRLAARIAEVPFTVHTFHGHLLHGYFSPATTKAITWIERGFALDTDRLVAVGDVVRDELLAAGVGRPEQYRVIPPGVDLAVPDRELARQQLQVNGPVVSVVGRLAAVKRPDRMLQVARLLPDVTFIVAGEGPLFAATRAAAPDNVRFLGWRADVATIYAAADVALLTSDNEGMPLALVEAALCGTPAVSTDVGSAREVVTGEVTSKEPAALAAAVQRVLGQDLRNAAHQHARQRFGVGQMLSTHADLYSELGD